MICTAELLIIKSWAVAVAASDPTFDDSDWVSMGNVPGASGTVNATVIDAAGNLYIGGEFNAVANVVASNIAKWDGTNWWALGSGVDGNVQALAISGSVLYAGGWFTTAGGVPANYVAKWDGTNWTALAGGLDYLVNGLWAYNGDLYAGGSFSTATNSGGFPVRVNHIAKWNGVSWSSIGGGVNGFVDCIVNSGSILYIGGAFSSATNYFGSGGTVSVNNIARWNGSAWSSPGSGLVDPSYPWRSEVFSLAVSGSDVYAGGYFVTGSGAINVAKWNGSAWSALGGGCDGGVYALTTSAGVLHAGGIFGHAGSAAVDSVARWDGTSWSRLASGPDTGAIVNSLAASASNLFAGGSFSTAGGMPASYVARWDGGSWSNLASGAGLNNYVNALARSGNDLYVGGQFTFTGTAAANRVVKWSGSDWSSLGQGISAPAGYPYDGGQVSVIAVSGNEVYVGGNFTTAGTNAAASIAKWSSNHWVGVGQGVDNVVRAIGFSGSNVYAAGDFTTATNSDGGTIAACHVARWDGGSWSPVGLGVDGEVDAVAVSGTNVYVGGWFINASNSDGTTVLANRVAMWDGVRWRALGSGIEGGVSALVISGSNIYVGGLFKIAGGIAATNVARWDGNTWSALDVGLIDPANAYESGVSALAMYGGDLYAAGTFTMAGNLPVNRIARWDGKAWASLGSGANAGVNALAFLGSDLYAGGYFTTAGGKVSAYVARASLPLPMLSVKRAGSNVIVSWPVANSSGFTLEEAPAISSSVNWFPNTNSISSDATNNSVTIPAAGLSMFFRLRGP